MTSLTFLGELSFPPGLLMIAAGLLLPVVPALSRPVMLLGVPILTGAAVLMTPDGVQVTAPFIGFDLELVEGDKLSRVFGLIFSIMGFAAALFAYRQSKVLELSAAFFYAGSAIGVAMAGDLITVFIFWELMAIGSTVVVWAGGTEASWRAARRYLAIHLLGGVVLMIGVVGQISAAGSTEFAAMRADSLATWMIMIGFLINAGAPPFSAWIPDAYPEASPGGMVFLSAFTTKTSVYVLIRGFPGEEILIPIGLYMACYGIIYALLENDMRRILAYSIVNQVGFMITGVGIGTELALNGAAAHAFTHIIYKAVLLMSAGAVLYQTGKRKCTDLGGLFQTMPLTCLCGIIGAFAISSFPLTSGFISKSMITQASADENFTIVWAFLTAASAGVFLHAGIKFPWFVFFQKDSGMRPPDPPWNMRLAMILFAFLCIALGVHPTPLYALLPHEVSYDAYTPPHVVELLQLLLFSGLAFFVLLPLMKRTLTISLDFDWFYRVPGPMLARALIDSAGMAGKALEGAGRTIVLGVIAAMRKYTGPDGALSRTLTMSAMVFWAVALLAFFLGAALSNNF